MTVSAFVGGAENNRPGDSPVLVALIVLVIAGPNLAGQPANRTEIRSGPAARI